MNLQELSERYKLKIKKDSCGDEIIPGRPRRGEAKRPEDCCHLFYDRGNLGAYLSFDTKARYNSAKKRLIAAGLSLRRDGELDGIMVLNPEDEAQVKLFCRIGRIRVKRQLTEEQKEKMKARFNRS